LAQQSIGVGAANNDGTGDALRVAMVKIQNNFSELYANVANGFSGNVAVGNTTSSNSKLYVYSLLSNTSGSNTTAGQFISVPIANSAVSTTIDVRALRILVASNSQFKNATTSNTSVIYGISSIVNNGDSSSGGDAKMSTAVGIDARVQNYANGVTSNTITNSYVSNFILQQTPTSGRMTNGIAVRAVILNDGNTTSITAPVLFSGLVSNTALTNAYGVYISAENYNYLSGNTGIGAATPNAKLQVSGAANISGAVVMSNTTSHIGAATFSNTITVTGNVNFSNTMTVTGNTILSNFLLVGNTTTNTVLGYNATNRTMAEFAGNANGYTSILVRNANNGSQSSADFEIYNDSFSGTADKWVGMGILSSTFSNATYTIGAVNDAYLYTGNSNLTIGVSNAHYVSFFTNGTLIANERMRIDAGGNTGIGNTTPNAKLQVTGTANISGAVVLSNILTVTGNSSLTGVLTTNTTSVNTSVTTNLTGVLTTNTIQVTSTVNTSLSSGVLTTNTSQVTSTVNTSLSSGVLTTNTSQVTSTVNTSLSGVLTTNTIQVTSTVNTSLSGVLTTNTIQVTSTVNTSLFSGVLVVNSTGVAVSTNTLVMGSSNVGAANFANGYTRLPNGLLMQFGQLLVNTITAAQTFSVVTGTAFTNVFSMTTTTNTLASAIALTALSATSFTIVSNTAANVAVYWTAIGK
jgi:hypothetical protein